MPDSPSANTKLEVPAMQAPAGKLPIGDSWVAVPGTSPIVFPYTGETFAQAPVGDADDALRALTEAERVRAEMAALTTHKRRMILMGIHHRVRAAREELEELLILETGKPRRDCRTELERTLVTISATAEEVSHIHGETVPLDVQQSGEGMTGFYTRRPAGVVVGIAGFNYPLLLATHKLAPALAAGCPVIIKPSPNTPLATLELVRIARESLVAQGVSASAAQLVNGDALVGQTLVSDERAAVVSFTGSAKIGHIVAKQAAPRKALLELGSNTGFIVADDADVDAAVRAALAGGFYANGQACISVQRIVLVRGIAEEFKRKFAAGVKGIVVGDPRDEATQLAAVINEGSALRIRSAVAGAVADGASLVCSFAGDVDAVSGEGALVRPVVLESPARGAEVWAEEVFGPVVCLTVVDSVDEAIEVVNDSRYGLHAAIFTSSLESAFKALDGLDVGGVVVNEIPGFRSDIMPYGGVKDSGIGREGPRYAIEEFTVTRMAIIRPCARGSV